jgi:hypothetical protein
MGIARGQCKRLGLAELISKMRVHLGYCGQVYAIR